MEAGPYLYRDFDDADPVPCEVADRGGVLYALFPRTDEQDEAEIPVDELPGTFTAVH